MMRYRYESAVVGCLLISLAACNPPRPPTKPLAASTPTASASTSETPSVPAVSAYGYAASPITAFADEVTAVAVACVANEPLPEVSFPLFLTDGGGRASADGSTVVETRTAVEGNDIVEIDVTTINGKITKKQRTVVGRVDRGQVKGETLVSPLTPVAFFMEIDAVLLPWRFQAPANEERALALDETIVYLDKRGLYIARYEVQRRAESFGPLPPTLHRLGEVFSDLLTAIRAGDLPANMLTPAQVADLGPWASHRFKQPDLPTRASYRQLLQSFAQAQPIGYDIEHINILVVDAKGKTAFLQLKARGSKQGMGLKRLPLVRVEDRPDF